MYLPGKTIRVYFIRFILRNMQQSTQKMTIKRQLLPNNNRNENNNWMIVPSFLLQRKDKENYGNLIATMYTTGNC